MDWNEIDWPALERLRANFLGGRAGAADYWRSESDLASYDTTFAQRIGWKWDYVLAELARRGWSPPRGELLDWGCGSGIAGRAFLDHFGVESVSTLRVWDRSTLARQFATRRAQAKYPGLEVAPWLGDVPGAAEALERRPPICRETVDLPMNQREARASRSCEPEPTGETPVPLPPSPAHSGSVAQAATPWRPRQIYSKAGSETDAPPGTLLVSHVLNELTPDQIEALVRLIARSECVLWVEPGTYGVSRALSAIRERLRPEFNVIAPCPHQEHCGVLTAGNERHWCHHFASPPAEVFQDGHWSHFANLLGIDLRDLALSFLVLDRRPAPALPPGATRILGHPRIYKPHALLLSCDQAGVRERKLTKRALPEEFKRLKKREFDSLQIMQGEGAEVESCADSQGLMMR